MDKNTQIEITGKYGIKVISYAQFGQFLQINGYRMKSKEEQNVLCNLKRQVVGSWKILGE